ncbi:hypothetical protein SCORR_v1c10130 (plasmid) [Spiroplasma corruscae]|uniref:Uncharacterized protein n=1 Tax=Spiroplasma corruscae TaxID=216934 RepID=A0A222EQC6_9MOLU|nr:hypothetical protein [Spiroplasma corruscae]ASP28785.1 hypothetical protein SCORR_v1c10130 [Spiroplasma corruscae]
MSSKEAKNALAAKLNANKEDKNSLSSLLGIAKDKGADKIEQPHITSAIENIKNLSISKNIDNKKEYKNEDLNKVLKKGFKIKTISLYPDDIEKLEKIREKAGYGVTLSDCARLGIKTIYNMLIKDEND